MCECVFERETHTLTSTLRTVVLPHRLKTLQTPHLPLHLLPHIQNKYYFLLPHDNISLSQAPSSSYFIMFRKTQSKKLKQLILRKSFLPLGKHTHKKKQQFWENFLGTTEQKPQRQTTKNRTFTFYGLLRPVNIFRLWPQLWLIRSEVKAAQGETSGILFFPHQVSREETSRKESWVATCVWCDVRRSSTGSSSRYEEFRTQIDLKHKHIFLISTLLGCLQYCTQLSSHSFVLSQTWWQNHVRTAWK